MGEEKTKELFLILEPGESENYPEGKDDNTHFSDYGARIIAKLVAEEIKTSKIPLKEYLINREVAENANIIVAKDGTGNFNTIQDAIESIKPNNEN